MGCGSSTSGESSRHKPFRRRGTSKSSCESEGGSLRTARGLDSITVSLASVASAPLSPSSRIRSPGRRLIDFATAVDAYMATRDDDKEQSKLRRIFNVLDAPGRGYVEFHEVQRFWKEMGWCHSDSSIRTMFNLADRDGTGCITWTEFVRFFGGLESIGDLEANPDHKDWVHTRVGRRKRSRAWEYGTREIRSYEVIALPGHQRSVKCLDVDESRPYVYSSSWHDMAVRLYDVESQVVQRTFVSTAPISCIAVGGNGKHLLAASMDGWVVLWDSISGYQVEKYNTRTTVTALAVALEPDNVFYVGTLSGRVQRFSGSHTDPDVESGQLGDGSIASMASVPGGLVVGSSTEKLVRVLDPDSLAVTNRLLGHTGLVHSVIAGRFTVTACPVFIRLWGPRYRLSKCFTLQKKGVVPSGVLLPCRGVKKKQWLSCTVCPGDFAHIIAASCTDGLLYFWDSEEDSVVLTIHFARLVVSTVHMRDPTAICVGDDLGNLYAVSLR
eukprot:Sspe_Gene.43621::Locus_21294_Transcript_1_1_Confidence_1.000_Length_1751::g.43621::m.43621